LFSGAGGFELGFQRAGIETVLQVEIDPVCLSVLERHWPETERLHDVRDVGSQDQGVRRNGSDDARQRGLHTQREHVLRSVDLIYGGFPCQDVSVAGQRAGLRGERSGLWHEFQRVLSDLRPRWVVVENVPGLLSSGAEPGADFGVVLRGLVDLGYGVAWRVLDARWFGVPQRRRRVFVVGCLGDAPRAAQVLAVCESCGGDPQTGGETGQDVTAASDGGARDAGLYAAEPDGVSRPLVARESGYRMDLETENFLVASADRASDGHHGHSSPRGDGADNLIAFHSKDHGQDADYDISPTVRAAENANGGTPPAIAGFYSHRGQANDTAYTEDGTPPLLSTQTAVGISGSFGVRRLTPLECERLMGWPDEHTRYAADGREIPDSHRYRLCGNGVVATVAEWIGHRLTRANCG